MGVLTPMHFGRAIYCVTSGDMLTVISPIDYLFCGFWLCGSVITAILLSIKYGVAKPAPWIWNALGTLVILGVVSASATVRLDPHAGKVYITRVLFYYPTREVYDLAALQGAVVGASDQSDALQLVFSNGVHTQLTPYTQMGGKNQAAAAINAFVQQHGGQGVEY
jgi:hypothetical protein